MQANDRVYQSYSSSKKIYIPGAIYPDIRVPMREISLRNSTSLCLYDTSGPYTDPKYSGDINQGLPHVRSHWINLGQDTEEYNARPFTALDNGYKDNKQATQEHARTLQRQPRRAKTGLNITQLHYAKKRSHYS